MAKNVRVDTGMDLEGHDAPTRHEAETYVKKGKFMQVGTCVPLAKEAYSPNRKSGTANGATGGAE